MKILQAIGLHIDIAGYAAWVAGIVEKIPDLIIAGMVMAIFGGFLLIVSAED